ncbi:unnamed protein product, partial [Pylaiella littoralis]
YSPHTAAAAALQQSAEGSFPPSWKASRGCCVHASIKHGNGQPATSNRRSLQGILSLVSPPSSITDTTVHGSDRRKKTKHKHVTITPLPLAAPSVKACHIWEPGATAE